jgi:microcompartment protein CcmL/EutN
LSEDVPPSLDPAIALIEFDSIARGIVAGDAMVKVSPLGSIYIGTVHPGKYLVLVSGDTASVEEAIATGHAVGSNAIVDSMFLPDVHPAVSAAICSSAESATFGGEALGIIETSTVAAVIDAADAGVKAARVDLMAVRLADGLGGKGYALFSGALADVEAAVEAAAERAEPTGSLLEQQVIAQLHGEIADNLLSNLHFMSRIRIRGEDRES